MGVNTKVVWGKLLTPLHKQIEDLQKENEELRAASGGASGNSELLAKIEALEEGVALSSNANIRLQSELDTVTKERDEAAAKLAVLAEQNLSLGDVLRDANKKNEALEAEIKKLKAQAKATKEPPAEKKK